MHSRGGGIQETTETLRNFQLKLEVVPEVLIPMETLIIMSVYVFTANKRDRDVCSYFGRWKNMKIINTNYN